MALRSKSEQLAFTEEDTYCVIMQYIHEISIIQYNMCKQHEYILVLTQICGCTYMCVFLSILFIHQSKMNLATSLLTRQTAATQTFGSISDLIQFLFANTLSQCSLIFWRKMMPRKCLKFKFFNLLLSQLHINLNKCFREMVLCHFVVEMEDKKTNTLSPPCDHFPYSR